MDKKCLECLINAPKKDSLLSNYSLQILNFKKIITKAEEKSLLFEHSYIEEKEISTKLNADLEKARSWNKKILIIGPLAGLAAGILILR